VVLNYNKIPDNVEIKFATPSLVNQDRLLERTMKKYDAGFITLREAIATLNPDADEQQLDKLVSDAENRQNEIKAERKAQIDGFGNYE
jgi:exonuclease VII small subunit